MADTPFQKKFKAQLKAKGHKNVKDIPADEKDDFFNAVDDSHQSKKEKKGDYSESMTRASKLLSINKEIEEDFYKKNKGDRHRNRNANGMGNIGPRNTSDSSSAASDTSSHTNVSIAKPGIEGGGKMSSGGGNDLNWVS